MSTSSTMKNEVEEVLEIICELHSWLVEGGNCAETQGEADDYVQQAKKAFKAQMRLQEIARKF